MKRIFQEQSDSKGEEIRIEVHIDRGESLPEGFRQTLVDDLVRAVGAHDTVLIVRPRQASDDDDMESHRNRTGASRLAAQAVFNRILEINVLNKRGLGKLLEGRCGPRQVYRLANGQLSAPGVRMREAILQLHKEGKLQLPDDIVAYLRPRS